MVANTKIEHQHIDHARHGDLEAQVQQLLAEIDDLSAQLAGERAQRLVLERAVASAAATARALEISAADDGVATLSLKQDERESEDVFVLSDEDEFRAAFDEFFAAPDPHLEKVRRFLLD